LPEAISEPLELLAKGALCTLESDDPPQEDNASAIGKKYVGILRFTSPPWMAPHSTAALARNL
jgi:hypothetical protein